MTCWIWPNFGWFQVQNDIQFGNYQVVSTSQKKPNIDRHCSKYLTHWMCIWALFWISTNVSIFGLFWYDMVKRLSYCLDLNICPQYQQNANMVQRLVSLDFNLRTRLSSISISKLIILKAQIPLIPIFVCKSLCYLNLITKKKRETSFKIKEIHMRCQCCKRGLCPTSLSVVASIEVLERNRDRG